MKQQPKFELNQIVWHYLWGRCTVEAERNILPRFVAKSGEGDMIFFDENGFEEGAINQSVFAEAPKIITPKVNRTRWINGVELPDYQLDAEANRKYYVPDITVPTLRSIVECHAEDSDTMIHLMNSRMLYPFTVQGSREAVAHAEALLNYTEAQPWKGQP